MSKLQCPVLQTGHGFSSAFFRTRWSVAAFGVAPLAPKLGVPTVVTLHCLWGYLTPAFRLIDGQAHWSRWPVVLSAVSDVAAVPLRRIEGADDVSILVAGTIVSGDVNH